MISDFGLSHPAEQLTKAAIEKCRNEIKRFGRIRTSFFFLNQKSAPEYQEFRSFMDQVIREFGMESPFSDRDSDYSLFVNNKFFDVLSMKLHREHPEAYLVSTQNDEGQILFIIRDRSVLPFNNLKVIWNGTDFKKARTEKVPIHLSKSDLT